jgi:hypothetical protein
LSHAKVEKFSPPDSDPYDRWVPDLHKQASALVQEWCDEVLFATYQVSTIKRDEGYGATRTRAIGNADRVVHTAESPTHAGKRRITLPDTLPLDWAAYRECWPTMNGQLGNVTGIVIDGHSKQKVKVS